MTYTKIRRGPMGGDHYTQIHNGVFRDRALTPNAKAIFGWISTHQQGWNTSIAAIARDVSIGQAAAKHAVQLLKQRHYLVFGRDREEGRFQGQAWYFITDLPAQLAAAGVTDELLIEQSVQQALDEWLAQNRRSAPGGQKCAPGAGEAEPTCENAASAQVGTKRSKNRQRLLDEQRKPRSFVSKIFSLSAGLILEDQQKQETQPRAHACEDQDQNRWQAEDQNQSQPPRSKPLADQDQNKDHKKIKRPLPPRGRHAQKIATRQRRTFGRRHLTPFERAAVYVGMDTMLPYTDIPLAEARRG